MCGSQAHSVLLRPRPGSCPGCVVTHGRTWRHSPTRLSWQRGPGVGWCHHAGPRALASRGERLWPLLPRVGVTGFLPSLPLPPRPAPSPCSRCRHASLSAWPRTPPPWPALFLSPAALGGAPSPAFPPPAPGPACFLLSAPGGRYPASLVPSTRRGERLPQPQAPGEEGQNCGTPMHTCAHLSLSHTPAAP